MTEDEVLAEDGASLIVDLETKRVRVTALYDVAVDLEIRVRREDVEVGPRHGQLLEGLEPLVQEHVVGVEDGDEVATAQRELPCSSRMPLRRSPCGARRCDRDTGCSAPIVSSVEPSSQTITSRGARVCESADSTASAMVAAAS